jgi:hypothetical protein
MGKGPPGLKRGDGHMTHGNRGRVALEDGIMGKGPTLVKHRAVEEDGITRVPLI